MTTNLELDLDIGVEFVNPFTLMVPVHLEEVLLRRSLVCQRSLYLQLQCRRLLVQDDTGFIWYF